MPQTQMYSFGSPDNGGFAGVYLGASVNDLQPNQAVDTYNCLISDQGLEARGGALVYNANEVLADTGFTGFYRHYDGVQYRTFAKCGTRVYEISTSSNHTYLITGVVEAGDTSNQLSAWVLTGGGNHNTNAGVLYWKLAWVTTTATVSLYKNSDGAAGNLVAQGSGVAGSVTLTAQNSSGLSGTVTVAAKVGDDTDLASNTLTYPELTADAEVYFESWLNQYFFCDGTNMYTGTTGGAAAVTFLDHTGAAITGTSIVGPRILFLKDNRLYILSNTKEYYTEPGYYNRVHVDTGSNVDSWEALDQDDGKNNTGFKRHRDKIMIFKKNKCGFTVGDYDEGNLRTDFFTEIGCYDQKTIAECGDGFIRWWGPKGVYEWSEETGLRHISKHVDADLKLIAEDYKTKPVAIYWDHYYILAYPYLSTGTYNTKIVIADVNRRYQDGQPYWMTITGWNMSRFCVFEDDTLHGARSDEGFIDKLFYGSNDNGLDIETRFLFKPLKFTPGYESVVTAISANVIEGYNLTVNLIGDKKTKLNYPVVINYPSVGTYWADETRPELGGFEWGDDDDPSIGSDLISDDDLGPNSDIFEQVMPGELRFNELQVEIIQKSAETFKLDYIEVYYTIVRRSI